MFDGYLNVGGVEILNVARTFAYVTQHMPGVTVHCNQEALRDALGHSVYTSPEDDSAPWYQGNRVAAGRFYGLFPLGAQGADDSTRSMKLTQLIGDGAVHTMPRHGPREIRVKAVAFAQDYEALSEGLAWLRDVLAGEGCSDPTKLGCLGKEVVMYAAVPTDSAEEVEFRRTFHQVETTDGPQVTKVYPSKSGVMVGVEFTLTAGVPWAFTTAASVATLNMDTALNFQDPVGENCSPMNIAYDQYIDDPYFTGISRPPQPPVIAPPNILAIHSWRRLTAAIPAYMTQRWGRTVPLVRVWTSATAAQFLRVRFYRQGSGLDGCDFDGEFLVSYIPAWCMLTLDAIRRSATIRRPDGSVVPAGHLLFGSDGRPFQWPSLGCQYTYTMTADLMPGQANVSVYLEAAVRE
jgi:hypothetical protein